MMRNLFYGVNALMVWLGLTFVSDNFDSWFFKALGAFWLIVVLAYAQTQYKGATK